MDVNRLPLAASRFPTAARAKPQAALRRRLLAVAVVLGVRSVQATVVLTWDGSGSNPASPVDGSGIWDSSHAQWSNGSTDVGWPANYGFAVFGTGRGAAGVVTVPAAVSVDSIVFNNSSGDYTLAGPGPIVLTPDLGIPVITVNGSPTISAAINASSGLTVNGTGTLTLTGANKIYNSAVNGGTLVIGSPAAMVSGNLTVGAGGAVTINAAVAANTTVNNGNFTIAAGGSYNGSTGFTQNAGSLVINGAFTTSASGFGDYGGTITGTINLNGGSQTVYFGKNTSGGTFNFTGPNVYAALAYANSNAGNIPAGSTITAASTTGMTNLAIGTAANYGAIVVTTNTTAAANLSFPNGLTNHGAIMVATTGDPAAFSHVTNAWTNGADGTVNLNTSAQLTGNFTNLGTYNIAAGATAELDSSQFNQSAGVLNIAGKFVCNATFADLGGTINGVIDLNNNATLVAGPSAAPGLFRFGGIHQSGTITTGTFNGNIPSGVVITAQATTGNTTLSSGSFGLTNRGSITVTSADGGVSTLFIPGSTLTNAGTLTLNAAGTPSGLSTIVGSLDNTGTLNIATSTNVQGSLNCVAGNINVAAGTTLNAGPLRFSGGSVNLAADAVSPAVLKIAGITWSGFNTPSSAVIGSVGGGTMPGRVDLNGSSAVPFNIYFAAPTVIVSADVINGGIDKQGPGTVVLSGDKSYTGPTQVSAGTLVVTGALASPILTVSAVGTLNLSASQPAAAVVSQGTVTLTPTAGGVLSVGALNLSSGTAFVVSSGRAVLVAGGLSVTGTSTRLDLAGNDLIVNNGDLAAISGLVAAGGVGSSTAAADPAQLTALGVVVDGPLFSTDRPFDGYAATPSDVLVKYTYFGDADLDGKVDGSDYARIDFGYLATNSTGWFNGDFNYDGAIDGSDYSLMDNAYNRQTGPAGGTSSVGLPASMVAGTPAVPEPASIAMAVFAALALARRRR